MVRFAKSFSAVNYFYRLHIKYRSIEWGFFIWLLLWHLVERSATNLLGNFLALMTKLNFSVCFTLVLNFFKLIIHLNVNRRTASDSNPLTLLKSMTWKGRNRSQTSFKDHYLQLAPALSSRSTCLPMLTTLSPSVKTSLMASQASLGLRSSTTTAT